MFRLLRFYALFSFAFIVIAAIALSGFYRHFAMQSLMLHGEEENLIKTQQLARDLRPLLLELFKPSNQTTPPTVAIPHADRLIRRRIAGQHIVKVKLYAPAGTTVYSTELAQIGEDQSHNEGVLLALTGEVISSIIHRNSFNAMDRVIEERDLLQSYIPIYDNSGDGIIGVFELYSDYTHFLQDINTSHRQITVGVIIILLMLYVGLIYVVRYAERVLRNQNQILRKYLLELEETKSTLETKVKERTQTLSISNEVLEREIKERIELEATLIKQREHLEAIMDNAFIGIITVDNNGNILSTNALANRIFGYAPAELDGQNVDILIPHESRQQHQQYLMGSAEQHDNILGRVREIQTLRKDGTLFPMELAMTRITEKGAAPVYIGTMRDISERKQTEQELQETRQKYFHQEKMAAIGTLSAGIVHEIGNPIAAISGLLESICQDADAGQITLLPETRAQLDLVLEQVQRIIHISHDVSEFSTPHSSSAQLIDFNSLVGKTVRLMRHDKRLQQVEVVLDLNKELPAIEAVSDHLIQILMNLITNAADALQDQQEPTPLIKITTTAEGERIRCSVSDNGCGMNSDAIEHATDAFYTTKPVGQGTGLGLSLCFSLIRAHQGDIIIESTPGQGTEVTIYLPLPADQMLDIVTPTS